MPRPQSVWEPAVGATVEWYTPPDLFDILDLRFDLDPASPPGGVPWVPADRFLSPDDNGLWHEWTGRVWLNPPYDRAEPWVDRMIAHGNGLLLIYARTEAKYWQNAAMSASAVTLLRERLWFVRSDGYVGRAPYASTLFAFGPECAERLVQVGLGYTIRDRGNDAWAGTG